MNLLSYLGMGLSVIALLGLVASGPGCRWGLWGHKIGIGLVKFAGFASFVAVLLSLGGVVLSPGDDSSKTRVYAIIGIVVGSFILGFILKLKRQSDRLPAIHDITTDTENPPLFLAILPLRKGAENPAEYGGPEIAKQQKTGYPNLEPGWLSSPPTVAFSQVLQTAKEMGWEIVDYDPTSLRIEATDTTYWFGFKDDIVVRLSPTPIGSRIDVRSASRVGKSDFGNNARRINTYLARLT